MSHLDLDALADALAAESGDLPPEHLAGCDDCRSRLADLRAALPAVASDLAALPAVPAVPAALERSVVPTASPGGATVLPAASLDEARSRRGLLAVSGLAAAAVLVVGGGLLLTHNATDTSKNATVAARNGGTIRTTNSGTDYRTNAALTAALPTLLGAKDTAPDTTSTRNGPLAAAATADPLANLHTTAGLAACLAGIIGPDHILPLALDYARYKGTPALVVVLPSTRPSKVDVYIVGATCNQTEQAVLYYLRADRPG